MRLRRVSYGDGGAIAIVVAVFVVVAFGFAAIVVDLGYARSLKLNGQDAADAAALAGAAALFAAGSVPDFDEAVNQAQIRADGVMDSTYDLDWGDCSGPDPGALAGLRIGCVSFDSPINPRQVRVRLPSIEVPSFFGGVYEFGGTTVSAMAVASLGALEFVPECAICVLGSGPHLMDDAEIQTDNADIAFDGNVQLLGASTVAAAGRTVFVHGTANPASGFSSVLVPNAGPIDNPLTNETPPVLTPRTDPCNPDDAIGGPGIYSGTTLLTDGCELDPGTYIITGALTSVPGAEIDGTSGVQFRLQGGSIDLSAADEINLAAPPGRSLIYSRAGSPNINIFGTSGSVTGDINAPSASLAGNDCGDLSTVGGFIVVAELDVNDQCLGSTQETDVTIAPPDPPVLIR